MIVVVVRVAGSRSVSAVVIVNCSHIALLSLFTCVPLLQANSLTQALQYVHKIHRSSCILRQGGIIHFQSDGQELKLLFPGYNVKTPMWVLSFIVTKYQLNYLLAF